MTPEEEVEFFMKRLGAMRGTDKRAAKAQPVLVEVHEPVPAHDEEYEVVHKRGRGRKRAAVATAPTSKGLLALVKKAHAAQLNAIRVRHRAAILELTNGVNDLRRMMADEYRQTSKSYRKR